jgi:hypothetical protein
MLFRQLHAERAETSAEHNLAADYHVARAAALVLSNKMAAEAHRRAATAHFRAGNFTGPPDDAELARRLSKIAWAAEVGGLKGLEPVSLGDERLAEYRAQADRAAIGDVAFGSTAPEEN